MRPLLPMLFAALAGCGVVHSAERDPKPPVALPETFSADGEASLAADWWRTFEDRELDALVDRAFAKNLDLRRAYARLEQVRAIHDGANAGFWPSLTMDAQASRTRTVFNPQLPANEFNQFSISAAASYEVDLWGRVYSTSMAAQMDEQAAENDVDAATVTLAAQIAETWFNIVEQRARKSLTAEQIRSNGTYLELVELRFEQGVASGLDVFQQRQQLASTKAVLPQIEARLQVLENQLAVLLGAAPTGVPQTFTAKPSLPEPPKLPSLGIPADVVQRRPDVKAAKDRVVASDYRIGAAIADMFPAIRLSGSVGTRSFVLADLFSDFIWNLAAGITGPIFDGNRRLAEIDRSHAAHDDQLLSYGQVLLVAVREVEDALVQEEKQRAFVIELDAQLELARTTLSEARGRYTNGLSDYLPVLTALRSLQALEQTRVSAQRQLLSFRIQLCRAIAGAPPEGEPT